MADFIVVITGGIGSGKTAVSDRFTALGITVLDMDITAREVVEPGEPALADIVTRFGDNMLDAAGQLDRRAMREHVFANPDDRRWLEGLLHPAINRRIADQLKAATSSYAIVVNPLLRGKGGYITRVLVVDVPVAVQIERTMARDDVEREQAEAIVSSQIDRESRLALADDVIVNDGDLETLSASVDALHRDYLDAAGAS
jgi:dephospho-CoA kinase